MNHHLFIAKTLLIRRFMHFYVFLGSWRFTHGLPVVGDGYMGKWVGVLTFYPWVWVLTLDP